MLITFVHVFIFLSIYFIISLCATKIYNWFVLLDDNVPPPPLELFCMFWIIMIPLCFLLKICGMIEQKQLSFNPYKLLYDFRFKQWVLERRLKNSATKYLKHRE